MAPATATSKSALLSSSAGSSERIAVGLTLNADDAECSDSAASSLDHLAPICSSSPGASYNGVAAMAWHDDGDTTDDQDDAGWQLVAAKSSHKVSSGSSTGGHGTKAAVCGRCGMKGHASSRCRQPHCSRCNKWWHTEEECARACHACGSLEHKISASTPLCKSYKCRECGLYGHVYAECPNIVCNLCKQVGHKALDCPSIICNLCKQQGHKAVNCPNPRGLHGIPAAGGSKGASKQAAAEEQQAVKLHAAVPSQLRQSGSSCGSNSSPMSFAAAAAASAADTQPALAHSAAAQQHQQLVLQDEVPLAASQHPGTAAELQAKQQQQSQLLSQLYKAAPDAAVAFLDDSSKLQVLFCIEPRYLSRLIQNLPQHALSAQQLLLESAVQSVNRQQQQKQQEQPTPLQQQQQQHAWQQPLPATAAVAPHHGQQEQLALRSAISSSGCSTPASPATPKPAAGGDVVDATQGIKPGDLAPQLAKQLVAEFGDMLPNRWQQLPSWRQLEARLSFPDGNYVQRRLQFREKRRQLQLLTLQMRTAAAAARQQQAAGRAAGAASARQAAGKAVRVVAQQPQVLAASTPTPTARPSGGAPSSYAAALAGSRAAASAGTDAAASAGAASAATGPDGPSTAADAETASAAGPEHEAAAALSSTDSSSSTLMQQPEPPSSHGGVAVCRRCGMMGHTVQHCAQPKCSRCMLWWHSAPQCGTACQFCGSLDHQGDAEQPASCQSFRCKACKMFGHTASVCPHVELHHQQQEKARQTHQQQQQQLSSQLDHQQQQQHAQQQQHHHQQHQQQGISPVATPTSVAAAPSSLSSSSTSISYQQLALQAPASPLGKFGGAASNGSSTWDSPLRPPDSPGLGQHGVKPKDLLPEHARALQDEFPNALPPGWQQMASWRMVEERLRVVAVEGAVFSKRRQMWRDRRKHYQVLTAQALAAAARSAADNAATAHAAVGEEVATATPAPTDGPRAVVTADSVGSSDSATGRGCSALEADASSREVLRAEGQQQEVPAQTACDGAAVHNQQQDDQQQQANGNADASQQQQQSGPHQLALLQRHDQEDLVPEWQQQRGSLFGLSALPTASGPLQLDGAGAGGSGFSCDTASFCCSPIPAVTPTVLLSPLGPDAHQNGQSTGNTPGPAHVGSSSSLNTPVIFAGVAGAPVSRHPTGPLHQVPSSQSMTGLSPRAATLQSSTPMPTPRGAAAAAAAMAAAAAAVSSGMAPASAAMGPYGMMVMGPMAPPDAAAGSYSPVHYAAAAGGVPPRGPMGYGMAPQQQSSPMAHHPGPGMVPGRGMPGPANMNMAGSPALYQQMLVAQRQSQLQQQLMLQSPYAPRPAPAAPEATGPPGGQQMMMNMQLQQQQHQARMQRQRRLEQAFMASQANTRQQQQVPAQPEENADTGELDDKLGVLGLLGLQ